MNLKDSSSNDNIMIRPDAPPSLCFMINDKLILTIEENGISFNKEAFPNWTPDEFANEFISILEKSYDIRFEKK